MAAEVIVKLGATLEPKKREVEMLLEMIKFETGGYLVEIAARSTDPKKAAAIVNAWGEIYGRYVNELYSGRPRSAKEIHAQGLEAGKAYPEAQKALPRFMGDNRIESPIREIEARQNPLADYYATKRGLDRLIGGAKALGDQVRKVPSSSRAADLPTLPLRANAFIICTSLPLQPQLSLGQMPGLEGSAEDQLGDPGALISVLEARRGSITHWRRFYSGRNGATPGASGVGDGES